MPPPLVNFWCTEAAFWPVPFETSFGDENLSANAADRLPLLVVYSHATPQLHLSTVDEFIRPRGKLTTFQIVVIVPAPRVYTTIQTFIVLETFVLQVRLVI